MVIVFAFLICLIPSLVLYFCLRRSFKDKPGYAKGCTRSLLMGLLSTLPIVLSGFVLHVIGALAGLKNAGWVIWEGFECFILYALMEELFKFLFFKRVLRKTECDCSWYDITAFMVLVGVGFGISESIVYSIDMSPISAIIRGFTVAHGGYGFIMGYFYAKGVKTGKKRFFVISFLLPYILHAVYDFSLVPELIEFNDNLAIIAVSLAVSDLVVLILMIVFFARRRKNEKYTASLGLIIIADKTTRQPITQEEEKQCNQIH